jgi:amino acid transporter
MGEPSKPALRRVVGTLGGLLLTLATLSPSLGVFVIGNDMLHQAGSATVACLLVATILGLAVAAVYAELGSAFPHPGAEYTLAGRVLGPRAGFAMMATNLIGLPISMAVSGLGIADYLQGMMPGLSDRAVAIPAILAATTIAACNIELNALVTGLLVAGEVAALAVTFSLGLAHAQPDGLHRLLHPTMAMAGGGIGSVPLGVLAVVSASGIYALNGYGAVVFFGEEMVNASARVGRVVFLALLIGAGSVALPLAAVLAAAPDLNTLYRSPAPITGFLHATGGGTVATLISLSVAGALFNCMVALALGFGRIVFAGARDEAWPAPASRALGRLSTRFGSPANATILFALISLPLCFVPLKIMILINGNLNIAVYGTLAVAVIIGRRRGSTSHSQSRAPWHPLAPLFVLATMVGLIVADLMDPETGRPALLAAALTVGGGVLYAEFVLRRNTRWRHRAAALEQAE